MEGFECCGGPHTVHEGNPSGHAINCPNRDKGQDLHRGMVEHVHLLHDPAEDVIVRVAVHPLMLAELERDFVPVSAIRLHRRRDGIWELHAKGPELVRESEDPVPPARGSIFAEPPPVRS